MDRGKQIIGGVTRQLVRGSSFHETGHSHRFEKNVQPGYTQFVKLQNVTFLGSHVLLLHMHVLIANLSLDLLSMSYLQEQASRDALSLCEPFQCQYQAQLKVTAPIGTRVGHAYAKYADYAHMRNMRMRIENLIHIFHIQREKTSLFKRQ